MRRWHCDNKGFTLIELLVVIAIIAILAAILFPVFLAARDKGRQAACINNQKQLGLAMVQYVDDWNGTFPTVVLDTAGASSYGFFYPLARYLKNEGVLRCPSAVTHPFLRFRGTVSYLVNGYPDLPAWPNLWGAWWGKGYTVRPPAKMAEIRCSTRIVAIQDWRYATYMGDIINGFYPWYCVPGTHNGGMTLTMADGHARWLKTEGLKFFEQIGPDPFTQKWQLTYPDEKISFSRYYQP